MDHFVIKTPGPRAWPVIGRLISESFPGSIAFQFGRHFATLFYKNIAKSPFSCSFAAFDQSGNLAGIIIGTLDRESSKQLRFDQKIKLLLAINFRLLSPKTLKWIIHKIYSKKDLIETAKKFPQAELVVIVITPEYRRCKLGPRLIDKMEMFFHENNLREPYLIITEASSINANRFYERIGAKLIKSNILLGHKFNAWQKSLP